MTTKLSKNLFDQLREKREQIANKGQGGDFSENFVQLEEGKDADVRLLPGVENEEEFFIETALHRIGQGKDAKNYHCFRKFGDKCPLCELYFDIWKDINKNTEKDSPEQKLMKSFIFDNGLKASERYYFNVLDRRDGKVKILSQGTKVFEKIVEGFLNEDYGNGKVAVYDPENGWDFRLRMEKVKGYNNYDKSAFRIKPSPLASNEEEVISILAKRHDLKALIKMPEFEEVRAIADAKRNVYRTEFQGIGASSEENPQENGGESGSESAGTNDEFAKSLEA